MFAVYDTGAGHYAQLGVNCLAVLGGFLAGYLLAAFAANSLDRLAFRRKSPNFLHRSVRLLGGLALATLIAFIVFSHGSGWTLLGGGQDGTGDSTQNGSPQLVSVDVKPTDATATTPQPTRRSAERIRITILGGSDVKAERFYLIGDDMTPRSLAEVKEQIRKRTLADTPSVEIKFAARNRLPEDHPAVVLLMQWLRKDTKLDVILPPDGR